MLELKAGAFYKAATEIMGLASWIEARSIPPTSDVPNPVFHEDTGLDDTSRGQISKRLNAFLEHLSILDAQVTILTVRDVEQDIARPQANWGRVKKGLYEITDTLRRELSRTSILVIEQSGQRYFSPTQPLFGGDFAAKFQTAGAYELDEAAKCLALSRPTAAVFHLMRILEVGIGALSACLGIPDPIKPAERNWAIILKRIKEDGIEKKWPTQANRMSGDGLLLESLYVSLDAVKNPWRNEAMHVSGKYTDDEAKHIFVAVEGFMKKLSARMDEHGEPKA